MRGVCVCGVCGMCICVCERGVCVCVSVRCVCVCVYGMYVKCVCGVSEKRT